MGSETGEDFVSLRFRLLCSIVSVKGGAYTTFTVLSRYKDEASDYIYSIVSI